MKSPPARRRRFAAFTLIEMLLAILVFGMVLSLLYSSWRIILQSNAAGLKLAADAQRTRLAMQTVEEALSSAVLFAGNATNYVFLADTSGRHATLSFVAHLGDSFPGSGRFDGERVRRLWFTVENGRDGTPELLLRQNSMLGVMDDLQQAFPIVLARNLNAFQVEFWDERKREFSAEWLQSNRLPAVVLVSMEIAPPGGRTGARPPEVMTRLVRLPAVGVAGETQGGVPGAAPVSR